MPVSDELLLKLIYQEENQKAMEDARQRFEKLSDAEKKFMQYEAEDAKLLASEMDRLTKAQNTAADSSEQAAGGFSKLQAGLVTLNAGLGIVQAAIGGIEKAYDLTIGKTVQYASQVKDLATVLDLSAEETSKLVSLSNKFGVSTETLTRSLEMMTKRGMAPSLEGLAQLSDQIMAIKDPVERAKELSDIFGRSWVSLMPIIEKGGATILAAGEEAHKFGLVLSEEDVAAAEKFTVASNTLKEALDGLTTKLTKDAIPGLATAAEDMLYLINKSQGLVTPLEDAKRTLDRVSAAFGENSAATAKAREEYEKLKAEVERSNFLPNLGKSIQDKISSAILEAKKQIALLAPTNLAGLEPEKQMEAAKTYHEYESKLTDIEIKGAEDRVKVIQDANDSIAKIEAAAGAKRAEIVSQFAADEASRLSDMRDKRIDILMSYSEQEQKITDSQNKERLKLAESYGIETERAEQAHQLAMQRMSEDHGRNLRKLADSRDALGIEDEQENYRINRDRAEQDYQIQAAQRSEDYARQLADQNAAAEEQRQAARDDQAKKLADLQESFTKQDKKYQDTYQKQLADLDKATSDQEKAVYDAQAKKLSDLQIAQDAERAQAADQWQQWRNEHEIFFAGEKALYDDYLKYTRDQLQAYINGGGATPTVSGGTTPTGIPGAGRASGGSVSPFGVYRVGENGPENLYMGSQGGYVAPNMGGGMGPLSVVINVGGSNASPAEIKAAVIEGVTDLFQKAMRQ